MMKPNSCIVIEFTLKIEVNMNKYLLVKFTV